MLSRTPALLCIALFALFCAAQSCRRHDEPDRPHHTSPVTPDNPSDPDYPTVHPDREVIFGVTVRQFGDALTERFDLPSGASVSVATVAGRDTTLYDYRYGDGKLTSAAPIRLKYSGDPVTVLVCYAGTQKTAGPMPAVWRIPADQSAGYESGVLLYGSTPLTYGINPEVTLSHLTAKVTFNIHIDGDAAPHTQINSIVLGAEDLALTGVLTHTSEGPVLEPAPALSSLAPMPLIAPNGYDASCTALLIPQNVGRKKLLRLMMSDGRELSWTAPDGEMLSPATVTTYDVTISSDLTRLTVRRVSGAEWTDGEHLDISSEPEGADYGPVAPGDYYYSDGSWSDSRGATANPVYTNPLTGQQREVIGIVITTDSTRIGRAERDELAVRGVNRPHGLVISTRVISSTQWDRGPADETLIGVTELRGLPGLPLYNRANAAVSGLDVCALIMTHRADEIAAGGYQAIRDCRSMAAPGRSTGWFVPAPGQWLDMLRSLTGMVFTDAAPYYFTESATETDDGYHFDWDIDATPQLRSQFPTDFVTLLNAPLERVVSGQTDLFTSYDFYFTAAVCDPERVYYVSVTPRFMTFRRVMRDFYISVRPVLAF